MSDQTPKEIQRRRDEAVDLLRRRKEFWGDRFATLHPSDGAALEADAAFWEEVTTLTARCEALTAERDTLLQKLSETDETRVSFAAGYTAALDDALKGKP